MNAQPSEGTTEVASVQGLFFVHGELQYNYLYLEVDKIEKK
jgi:hypothetical protein